MLFYWTLSSLKNPEKKCTTVSTKKTLSSTTVFTIEYQHIRVISDGCDMLEIQLCHHRNQSHFKMYLKIKQYSQY